jgi:hypothetical protein
MANKDKSVEQLSVPFSIDDSCSLQFEEHPPGSEDYSEPYVHYIRLYPYAGGAKLAVTDGSIVTMGHRDLPVQGETIAFSGSNRSSTQYPIKSLQSIESFFTFDKNFDPTVATFTVDGCEIIADKEIYGAAKVDYTTDYRLIKYNPRIEQVDFFFNVGGTIKVHIGVVAALWNGQIATYEIPSSIASGGDGSLWVEIYRIQSGVVITEDGAYEKPANWTGDTGSPTWSDGKPDPDEPNVESDRTHEVGFMNTLTGATTHDSYGIILEKPKRGTAWRPDYEIHETDPSSSLANPAKGIVDKVGALYNSKKVRDFVNDAKRRWRI